MCCGSCVTVLLEKWGKSERFYLQELNVVLYVREFVQFGLIGLQLSDLLLDLLQQLLGLSDGRLFLGFDQLPHLKALQLDRPDQFSKCGVALLRHGPSGALEEHRRGRFLSLKGGNVINKVLLFSSMWLTLCGTYSERENGLSQLLGLLFSLVNPHLRAALHVTELPLKKKYKASIIEPIALSMCPEVLLIHRQGRQLLGDPSQKRGPNG